MRLWGRRGWVRPVDVAVLLPDVAGEWAYRRALAREAYERGFAAAWEGGRRALLEELAGEQRSACTRGWGGLVESPEHAELERRRWGAEGRLGFGAPRSGDFRGRAGAGPSTRDKASRVEPLPAPLDCGGGGLVQANPT